MFHLCSAKLSGRNVRPDVARRYSTGGGAKLLTISSAALVLAKWPTVYVVVTSRRWKAANVSRTPGVSLIDMMN